jgi:hypothetical protein
MSRRASCAGRAPHSPPWHSVTFNTSVRTQRAERLEAGPSHVQQQRAGANEEPSQNPAGAQAGRRLQGAGAAVARHILRVHSGGLAGARPTPHLGTVQLGVLCAGLASGGIGSAPRSAGLGLPIQAEPPRTRLTPRGESCLRSGRRNGAPGPAPRAEHSRAPLLSCLSCGDGSLGKLLAAAADLAAAALA